MAIRKYACCVIIACVFWMIGASFGIYITGSRALLGTELTEADRQRIAIDFEKANRSWDHTLHDKHNFPPMDADKETTK